MKKPPSTVEREEGGCTPTGRCNGLALRETVRAVAVVDHQKHPTVDVRRCNRLESDGAVRGGKRSVTSVTVGRITHPENRFDVLDTGGPSVAIVDVAEIEDHLPEAKAIVVNRTDSKNRLSSSTDTGVDTADLIDVSGRPCRDWSFSSQLESYLLESEKEREEGWGLGVEDCR